MEIAGRAGGLIPTHKMALRDVVLRGTRDATVLTGAALERDACVVDELFDLSPVVPANVFLIASTPASMGRLSAWRCRRRPRDTR